MEELTNALGIAKMQLPEFLSKQPSGSIRLTGHRIALEHVVHIYNQGYSPEMILGQFPSLPLALVHKVIAFYLENKPDVDAYSERCESEVARQREAAPASPGLADLRHRSASLSNLKTP